MTATIVAENRLLAELDTVSPWPPADADAVVAQPGLPVLPLRRHVIAAIAEQAKCSQWRAGCTMRMLGRRARGGKRALTRWEMAVTHKVLAVIMPDYRSAAPGSVHELLDQRYLSDNRTFLHSKTQGGACHMGTVYKVSIKARK